MTSIVAIGHVGMRANDLPRLSSFYRDVLGLEQVDDLPVVSIFRVGSTDFFLSTYEPAQPFDLMTDDLEGLRDRLLARSVRCGPIRDTPPTHRSFILTDPEGNEITVLTTHSR